MFWLNTSLKELEMFFYEPFKVTKYIDSNLLAKTARSVLRYTLKGLINMYARNFRNR